MYELRQISREAIPAALVKAERYRLLNEPREAESICRDVLRIDPENREALVVLLLALTDQFGRDFDVDIGDARAILPRLPTPYERDYYAGVICERWGKALPTKGLPGYITYDWFREAMSWYEKAEPQSPPGNDDAVLRWNTCARFLMQHERIQDEEEARSVEPSFEDEVPLR